MQAQGAKQGWVLGQHPGGRHAASWRHAPLGSKYEWGGPPGCHGPDQWAARPGDGQRPHRSCAPPEHARSALFSWHVGCPESGLTAAVHLQNMHSQPSLLGMWDVQTQDSWQLCTSKTCTVSPFEWHMACPKSGLTAAVHLQNMHGQPRLSGTWDVRTTPGQCPHSGRAPPKHTWSALLEWHMGCLDTGHGLVPVLQLHMVTCCPLGSCAPPRNSPTMHSQPFPGCPGMHRSEPQCWRDTVCSIFWPAHVSGLRPGSAQLAQQAHLPGQSVAMGHAMLGHQGLVGPLASQDYHHAGTLCPQLTCMHGGVCRAPFERSDSVYAGLGRYPLGTVGRMCACTCINGSSC